MATDPEKRVESTRAAFFIENLVRLSDAIGYKLGEMTEEDRQQLLSLMGGKKPKDLQQIHLLFRACRLMYEAGTLTMSELSYNLLAQNYTATRLVNWMVSKGLAERTNDPRDGRIVRVALTAKGRQVYELVEGLALQKVHDILGRLTPDEEALFTRLLTKLVTA